jgi:cellulose biosynthesis protein BcsQ
MSFEISPVKVQELARISGVSQPVISRKFKEDQSGAIKNDNNRITGINSNAIEEYLVNRNQGHIYRGGAYLCSNLCGGTSKSSSCLSLGAAFRRIADPKKSPIIWCDYDGQFSLTSVLTGNAIPDSKPILLNYFENKAKLEDILTPVGNPDDNMWLIGSNLNNVFLEKLNSTPQAIRGNMRRLLDDLFNKFGERAKIFFDAPPQLSSTTSSLICAFSETQKKYDTRLLIPLRSDRFSYNGARLTIQEKNSILEAFNLPDFETIVFLSSFDKRLKISVDVFKQLLEDPILKDFVSPVVVRYSSEVIKAHSANRSIFTGSSKNTASEDYMDLMLYVMGYEKPEGNA